MEYPPMTLYLGFKNIPSFDLGVIKEAADYP